MDLGELLTFQDDDDLQVLGRQRLGGELVQGAPSLHGVADDQRRNQEDAIAPQRVLHLDVQLTHRDHLALRRDRPADHLQGNTSVLGPSPTNMRLRRRIKPLLPEGDESQSGFR